MASEVDIVNLALGYLGDSATVASLNPPEGSAQASHCARFYPVARDAMLEMHPWGFSTKRATLALLNIIPPSGWQYAYALPNDTLNLLAILDSESSDDYSAGLTQQFLAIGVVPPAMGAYTPQPYSVETINDVDVILTNQENAVLRYTGIVTDTTKFSPLFIEGLATLLASHLAGPVLKGELGRNEAKSWLQTFSNWFAQATKSDSGQRRVNVAQRTPWMANR